MNLIGQQLGNYRLEERLGSGGVGEVYLARHLHLPRVRAIKVLKSEYSADPTFRKRFNREAKTACALDSEHIVRVHDFGEHEGRFYLEMERMEGSLRELLASNGQASAPMSTAEAADVIRQAALGLAVAHGHHERFIHRDIKPGNLLYNLKQTSPESPARFLVKLTDFGLVRALEGSENLTIASDKTGQQPLGTPGYMSPEQCQGADIDERIDLYPLGIVFYELLTGRKPFPIRNYLDAVRHHMTQPAPQPDLSGVPAELRPILLRCLERSPDRRHQSAAALAADLQGWLRCRAAPAPTPTPTPTGLSEPPPFPGPADHQTLSGIDQTRGMGPTHRPEPTTGALPLPKGRIVADKETLSLTPGTAATLKVTLANYGQLVEFFQVVCEGVPTEWLRSRDTELQINPGATAETLLTVLAPRSPEARAGTYPVALRMLSTNSNTFIDQSEDVQWTVQPFSDCAMTLSPQRQTHSREARYVMALQNRGNRPERFSVHAADPDQSLSYRFEPATLSLEPGASAKVEALISRPRKWLGAETLHRFQLVLDGEPPAGDEPSAALQLTASGEFVHQRAIPRPMVGCAFLILAGALVSILGWAFQDLLMDYATDADGIYGAAELCPSEPEDKDDFEDQDGCPDYDNDEDGFSDALDKCPDEPEDKDDKCDDDGCPEKDCDEDGVNDEQDSCPSVAGLKASLGCPSGGSAYDNDGDAIPNEADLCPTEFGVPNAGGCPDGDRDGIANKDDLCPAHPGLAQYCGCPSAHADCAIDSEPDQPTAGGQALQLEGVDLQQGAYSTGGEFSVENMGAYSGSWSGTEQLRWSPKSKGVRLDLRFNVSSGGRYRLGLATTSGPDYGNANLQLNGLDMGKALYRYTPELGAPAGTTDIHAELREGQNTLSVIITGKERRSKGYKIGIDYLELTPE